ncbi:MAG: ABC transporter ATP-binding protein [Deltaproteobacteria bacterium CG03_land_8_20_14_0_80_45_14]|nr:MAG: ABC transporter ATP-binding protein [Deltaproteobacteria bacterium CG03_land_8_20_14_0_80_45_14]
MLLEVKNLVKEFGGVVANADISLGLERGKIFGLIGPNGAGKTTLFNCIAGYYKPTRGNIFFEGKDITGWPAHRVTKVGIARTFQSMKIMPNLTVEENVMVGAFCRISNRLVARRDAQEILKLLNLAEEANVLPTELPIATQKRIELARALATRPKLLMLDEIAAGLNPLEIKEIVQTLLRIKEERGLTLFLTEHVMEFIMTISEVVTVMAAGRKIAEGSPEEVAREEKVVEAYLGERYAKGKSD